MNDHDLDKVLSAASSPQPAMGYEQRLLGKVTSATNIGAFPKQKTAAPWLIGLPLAASLALGLWLGTNTTSLNPTNLLMAQYSEDITSNGFDDVVALIEDTQS